MPFIVATYVSASSQGQCTHSAMTNVFALALTINFEVCILVYSSSSIFSYPIGFNFGLFKSLCNMMIYGSQRCFLFYQLLEFPFTHVFNVTKSNF